MNLIEQLLDDLKTTLPEIETNIDRPRDKVTGRWWLDAKLEGRHVVVEWSPPSGHMGVSLVTDDTGYGEKADWVSTSYYRTFARVLHLLVFADV